MKQTIFTLEKSYREGARKLQEAGVPEAKLDAWYLLEHVTGISRAHYLGHPDQEMDEEQEERYQELVARRQQRIPLQHLTGEQYFMGYPFFVNEHVLIPRQDTEILVEEASKYLKSGMRVLDVCTGSGCILLSLLKLFPEVSGTGCDISGQALEVAKENAKRLDVQGVCFVHSDLFSEITGSYDMIVSNPPYIPTEEIEKLQEEVRLFDPMIALDGKADGLYFYRKIIKESAGYLRPGGRLLFEIGHDQGKAVAGFMEEAGYSQIMVKKDLAGLDRVVMGMYNKE